MKTSLPSCLSLMVLCVASAGAQSHGKHPAASAPATPVTDVRQADFQNRTYSSSLCSREFGRLGIGKSVRVRDGEFKNSKVYFAVVSDKIVFGDLTGDGHEDAIVPAECGSIGANFARNEIFLFSVKNGAAALVGQLSDRELERDYRKAYPTTESYWGVTGDAPKIVDGTLSIEILVEGPHAAPRYTATMTYRLTDGVLRAVGTPARREGT
jgi:hypothetical protein